MDRHKGQFMLIASLSFSARAATTAAPLGPQSPSIGCDRQSESQNGNPDGRQKTVNNLFCPGFPSWALSAATHACQIMIAVTVCGVVS